MPLQRRVFLAGLGAALAAPRTLRAVRATRYPIAFSTLGCPAWSWAAILQHADRLGYAAIELRGIAGELDLPRVPELSAARLPAARREVADRGLAICALGASTHMHATDPAERERQHEDGRRFVDLAQALGVPYVRMFGDAVPEGESRAEVTKRIVEGFQRMAAYAAPARVTVLMESHGAFTRSEDLAAIAGGVGSGAFALLWDAHHTFVTGQERPAETHAALGRWIRHVHLKDSRPDATGRRYVPTGEGEVPVREQVRVLAGAGYHGFYSFEWEKRWHPGIDDPEVAFPHYARILSEWLMAAGVRPA